MLLPSGSYSADDWNKPAVPISNKFIDHENVFLFHGF